jgi:peptidylprolyl isomerase
MQKNEMITLGAGVAVIIALAAFGGFFTRSKDLTINSVNSITTASTSATINNNQTVMSEVQGENISKDPKIQIIEVAQGTGTEAKNGSLVSVHYAGKLQDGTVFDSSFSRGEPLQFNLGTGRVIKGWDLGLLGMKVGGKRRLIISPEYAYGASGVPGVIPANATLIFDVELVATK